MKRESVKPHPLICAECGQAAKGWRALFFRSLPEDQPEVGVFCPECAEQESGST